MDTTLDLAAASGLLPSVGRWWSRSQPPASRRRPLLAIQCKRTGTRMRCGACFYFLREGRDPGVRLRTKLLSAYRRQRPRPTMRPTSTSARRTRRQAQAWQAAPELQSEARKALTAVRNCISRDWQTGVAAAVGTVKQPALSISLNTFQGDICTEADFRSWQSPRPTMACSSGVRNSLLETTRGADSFPPWNEP